MTPAPVLKNPADSATRPAVTLVTGFLGAGKTTWLSDVLREPGGLKLAVIVNDVGAINIDAALIRKIDDKKGTGPTTIELANGCICCSVRDELAEAVAELAARREHDHILIECSGVAEPQPIAQLFTERNNFGRSLNDFAHLHAVLAIVDTPELLRHCGQGDGGIPVKRRFVNPDERPRPLAELMLQQIEGADIVALNKTDLIAAHACDEAEAIVRGVNTRAEIHRTIKSRLPTGIWPGHSRAPNDANPPATWMRVLNQARGQAGLGSPTPGAGVRPASAILTRAESSAAKYGLQTFLFAARRPLDETRFEALLARGLPGVVRAKGFFWASGRPDDIGFISLAGGIVTIEPAGTWAAALRDHGVLTLQEIPAGIRALWQEPHGDRRQEIVFIGRDLDEAALRADLEACLLPG
jgi:G3E family GTPase